MNITPEPILAKLPIMEIKGTIRRHTKSVMRNLPDRRLRRVVENMLLGILGGQTPVITAMARQNSKTGGETWAIAKSIYRLLGNKRLETVDLYQGLYQVGQEVIETTSQELLEDNFLILLSNSHV